MAIITMPDGMVFGGFGVGQQRYDLSETSDITGASKTRLLGPPRWKLTMRGLDGMTDEQARLWKATMLQLRGGVNHLAAWDVARPIPRGTMRGTVTLSATAAAGATSITVAGARAGVNLLVGGSFEVDSNGDGRGDGWTLYFVNQTGTPGAGVPSNGLRGGKTQYLYAPALGTSGIDRCGITQLVALPAGVSSVVVSYNAHRSALGSFTTEAYIDFFDGGGVFVGGAFELAQGVPSTVTTRFSSAAVPVPPSATQARLHLWMTRRQGTTGEAEVYFDDVQLEPGVVDTPFAGTPTLTAGDWLQIGSGVGSHLCSVISHSLQDNGAGTITFEPPLRQSFASGTVVTWDKALGHYKRIGDDAMAWQYVAGMEDATSGFAGDFLEQWS